MDSEGNLYGTTERGGHHQAGLIMDRSGNLYGTTGGGGTPNDAGTVFKIRSDGQDLPVLRQKSLALTATCPKPA